LRDLMAMLDDHVRDEETEFFPMAQRVLGDQRAVELQERYESEQREVLHALANETR
jgi:hemerythrin-like domain-containing protein